MKKPRILTEKRMAEIKKAYFEGYPNYKELSFTNDGKCFVKAKKAKAYAEEHGLEWETVKNPALESKPIENKAPEKNVEQPDTDPETSDEPTKEEQLKAFELSEDCDWDQLRALASLFEVKGRSREELTERLKQIKDVINNTEE